MELDIYFKDAQELWSWLNILYHSYFPPSLDCISAVGSQQRHQPTLLHISHLLNAFAAICTRWDHSCPSDNPEYLPCHFPPQAQVQSVHSCYVSLRYHYWSLTSCSSYLKASEWYHSKQSLILAWLYLGHKQELKTQEQIATQHLTCLRLSTKITKKSLFLEDIYNYTCSNARPLETSFSKCDLSLNI